MNESLKDYESDTAANHAWEAVEINTEVRSQLNILLRGHIVDTKVLKGSHERYEVTLEHNGETYKAMFKLCPSGLNLKRIACNNDAELGASLVSAALGFDNTPPGILRTINIGGKSKSGFLYLFVKGASLSKVRRPDKIVKQPERTIPYQEMILFDFLISNYDRGLLRHPLQGVFWKAVKYVGYATGSRYLTYLAYENPSNFILGNDGKLYAIDHATAFSYALPEHDLAVRTRNCKKLKISKELGASIQACASDPKKLHSLLESLTIVMGKNIAQGFENRLQFVAKSISESETSSMFICNAQRS